MKHYEVIIIGAGSAGLSAAQTLKEHKIKYAIVEQGAGGTLCATTGCMPSKALVDAAHTYHMRKKFDSFGIEGSEKVTANIPRILQHVRNHRDYFVTEVLESMKNEPIIHGHAHFCDTSTIEINAEKYSADAIIICTGSYPHIPQPLRALENDIITTDNLFDQTELPSSIAVVGLGSSGLELAQALSRLGIKVYGLKAGNSFAGINDPLINSTIQSLLSEEFQINLESKIEPAEKTESGFSLKVKDNIIQAEGLLVTAGRSPNLKNLGLENTSITLNEDGIPVYDKLTMQIEGQPIYIAGDVNADRALQHEAIIEGHIAALHAIGKKHEALRDIKLNIVFTDPPIATVGKGQENLEIEDFATGNTSFKYQSRAILMEENHGQIRLYANPENQTLTGGAFIAPAADHMAHFLALAISKNMTAQELLNMPFYHPVLEEGLYTALEQLAQDLKKAA